MALVSSIPQHSFSTNNDNDRMSHTNITDPTVYKDIILANARFIFGPDRLYDLLLCTETSADGERDGLHLVSYSSTPADDDEGDKAEKEEKVEDVKKIEAEKRLGDRYCKWHMAAYYLKKRDSVLFLYRELCDDVAQAAAGKFSMVFPELIEARDEEFAAIQK
ncbi:hypothetical protein K491DRAFT_711556 [Lophiostoma macrostomum CBS 122681]|uniref:Uncharacterized protein n=1 Tax=Lophiostoma macrostomum CBS 122681 TaxID=1314788 RepID=A0A6A6TPY5_9PLEO|nr:hypothetical protein K491DRAFT_711556 [Lophiostoma macrostomum CBS 122681]